MSDQEKSSSDSKEPKDKTKKVKPPKKIDRLAARVDEVAAQNDETLRRLDGENEQLRKRIVELEEKILHSENTPPASIQSEKRCCGGLIDFFTPSKSPLSIGQASVLGILAAIILGITLFTTVRAFQWRGAINALRSEPGIEIFGVERRGFLGRKIIGLHDPLAPDIATILKKHQVDPDKVELHLTEYHSLNTPYQKQRSEGNREDSKKLHASLLDTVAKFAEASMERHDDDLEKITKVILETRFPEEMKTVEIRFEGGVWHFEGGLFDPGYSLFKSEVPGFLVRGTPHWDKLVDLTNSETSDLQENIESVNLFQKDADGKFAHLARLGRLIRDYDAVCEESSIPEPRLQIELRGESMGSFAGDVQKVKGILVKNSHISEGRFLPTSIVSGDSADGIAAHLRLVTLGSVQ